MLPRPGAVVKAVLRAFNGGSARRRSARRWRVHYCAQVVRRSWNDMGTFGRGRRQGKPLPKLLAARQFEGEKELHSFTWRPSLTAAPEMQEKKSCTIITVRPVVRRHCVISRLRMSFSRSSSLLKSTLSKIPMCRDSTCCDISKVCIKSPCTSISASSALLTVHGLLI